MLTAQVPLRTASIAYSTCYMLYKHMLASQGAWGADLEEMAIWTLTFASTRQIAAAKGSEGTHEYCKCSVIGARHVWGELKGIG